MPSIIILLLYYWLIIFSILGYGIFFQKFFIKDYNIEIGYLGIYGIFFLTIISYMSYFFIAHGEFFNSTIIIIGLIYFYFNKNIVFVKKNLRNIIIIFSVLILFILTAKNHDDFPYYHFPYTHLITQLSNVIGIGNFNHGFRTPSSIFYLSSLFNLPYSNLFLLNLSPVFFLGFSNLILLTKIKKYLKSESSDPILYLSLLCFIFINIFFYRLAEHGTDRSAMILIIIFIIEILQLNNIKKKLNEHYFLKLIVVITLIISLKAFYVLYIVLLIPILLLLIKNRLNFIFFFNNKTLYTCALMICLVLITNFFNSGCLIYPVKFLCFEGFSWSIPSSEVELMSNWYQQWSKGGAGPNFRVENPEIYIQNFNWVSNWINKYFFNKVSDYLLGLLFLTSFVFLIFYSKNKKKTNKYRFNMLYLILVILTFEWFYFHPTLRYGGYHLIALLLFIPTSISMSRFSNNQSRLKLKVYFLIVLTFVIFSTRNLIRINKEYNLYDYNILTNAFYRSEEQNFTIINKINNIDICPENKKSKKCSNQYMQLKKVNGYKIYFRRDK